MMSYVIEQKKFRVYFRDGKQMSFEAPHIMALMRQLKDIYGIYDIIKVEEA